MVKQDFDLFIPAVDWQPRTGFPIHKARSSVLWSLTLRHSHSLEVAKERHVEQLAVDLATKC